MGSVFGPPLMTGVFSAFTNGTISVHLPGAPFLLAAFLFLLGTVLLPRHGRLERP